MVRSSSRLWLVVVTAAFVACGNQAGCACQGFTQLPQGSYTGPRLDTAGSLRVSQQGFAYLNSDAGVNTVLALFAPGGVIRVPVPCTLNTTSLLGIPVLQLAIGDEGSLFCNDESCGLMDGRCTTADAPKEVAINISSLVFSPRAPDLVEARMTATVQTGTLHISSVNRGICGLFGGGAIKCTVDFDTARAPPAITQLDLNIRLTIDTRWDKLLALEINDIGGASACSGGTSAPQCIDPNDIVLAKPPGVSCNICTLGQFGVVKNLLIGQLTNALKKQLNEALGKLNCASCAGAGSACPTSSTGLTSMCVVTDGGPGQCVDSSTGKCVPGLIGTEGRLDVSQALPGGLVAPGSSLEFALGAGGSVASNPQGATIGLRGGAKEVRAASCVVPAVRPAPITLPLPDFDRDAPGGGYDVAFSISQQFLSDSLYRVQQSGALCLELGTETVALLESGVLSTLLPSLKTLTGNTAVPLRVVIRPVKAPTMVVGEGTLDATGKPLDPLLLLDWPGVEVDVYALLEDRYARLFTITADLKLPFALDVAGCDQLRPVVGSLTGAVSGVKVTNSEVLAEDPSALSTLVPSLLALAEPALAAGFPTVTLPDLPNFAFKVQLLKARGVGQVAGTSTYNHLGIYARLYPASERCMVTAPLEASLTVASRSDSIARVVGLGTQEVSFRVDQGFWSTWQQPDVFGQAVIEHPRLRLGGPHVLELRGRDGRVGRVELR